MDEIKFKCKTHGELLEAQLNKCGIKNGNQRYKCKICAKAIRDKNYQKNKEKTLKKQADWRKNNKEKITEIKKLSYHKNKNNDNQKTRRKKYWAHGVGSLTDTYVRGLMHRDSNLNMRDIPDELVELKRVILKIKRQIKEKRKDKAECRLKTLQI